MFQIQNFKVEYGLYFSKTLISKTQKHNNLSTNIWFLSKIPCWVIFFAIPMGYKNVLVLVLAFTHLTIKCGNGLDQKGKPSLVSKKCQKLCYAVFSKSLKLYD